MVIPGNLQIALLDLESRVAGALAQFPDDRIVKSKPPIYTLVAARPKPAPVPVVVVAPPPAPVPAPMPVAVVAPAPTPVRAPVVALPPPAPAPAPMARGGFDEIPADFPMETGGGTATAEHDPWYKKWWIWTIAGVVVAGAVTTTAVMLTRGGSSGDTFSGKASW